MYHHNFIGAKCIQLFAHSCKSIHSSPPKLMNKKIIIIISSVLAQSSDPGPLSPVDFTCHTLSEGVV